MNKKLENKEYLLAVGRALFVCQKFEKECSAIVDWFNLHELVRKNPTKGLLDDEIRRPADRLVNKFLGMKINHLKDALGEQYHVGRIDDLTAAKDSRNFICHEGAMPLYNTAQGNRKDVSDPVVELKEHVQNVAKGDYIVSQWSYSFHHHELLHFGGEQKYTESITNWVLYGR